MLTKFKINGIIVNANESTSATHQHRAHTFRHQPDIANTVMGRRLFYETNMQKAAEKPLIKCTKSTPNLNRMCATATTNNNNITTTTNSHMQLNENARPINDAAAMSKHDKYCRNIVSTTKIHFENTKALHDSNELNYRVQKVTTPTKSAKLLNNLNVMKSRKYPETVKADDE